MKIHLVALIGLIDCIPTNAVVESVEQAIAKGTVFKNVANQAAQPATMIELEVKRPGTPDIVFDKASSICFGLSCLHPE